MESKFLRNNHVKKGLQFSYDNDGDGFRMALTRLPVQYRTYWPLKALGLSKRFHCEENVKAALADKKSYRYGNFTKELRAVFLRDERLYNFVWERLLYIDNDIDGGCSVLMEAVGLSKLRWAQASASEEGATDLADGTCGDVDVDRSGGG